MNLVHPAYLALVMVICEGDKHSFASSTVGLYMSCFCSHISSDPTFIIPFFPMAMVSHPLLPPGPPPFTPIPPHPNPNLRSSLTLKLGMHAGGKHAKEGR